MHWFLSQVQGPGVPLMSVRRRRTACGPRSCHAADGILKGQGEAVRPSYPTWLLRSGECHILVVYSSRYRIKLSILGLSTSPKKRPILLKKPSAQWYCFAVCYGYKPHKRFFTFPVRSTHLLLWPTCSRIFTDFKALC